MDKSDKRSLVGANDHSLSARSSSLAARGLRDLQRKQVSVDSKKLLPALAKVMDAVFRMGYLSFTSNARFVLNSIREQFGDEAANAVTLDELQGCYIGMAAKYKHNGVDSKNDVVGIKSLKEIFEPNDERKQRSVSSSHDPEFFKRVMERAVFHVEAGAKAFPEYVERMLDESGQAVRPYLRCCYEAIRNWPGFDSEGMSSTEEVNAIIKKKGLETNGQAL